MATNQTTNYQLNQWEPTDQVLRTDFNADNAKLDAALNDLSSSKADASALTQAEGRIAALEAGKADSADLTALSVMVDSLTGRTGALETAVTQRGNCRIEIVAFMGNGKNSVDITFSQKPACFFVVAGRAVLFSDVLSNSTTVLEYDSILHGAAIGDKSITWSGSIATISIGDNLLNYFNKSGIIYRALAFIQTDAR